MGDESKSSCGICYELNYPPFTVVPCGHSFCGTCVCNLGFLDHHAAIMNREPKDRKCPVCRTDIAGPAIPNISLRSLIEDDPSILQADRDRRRSEYQAEVDTSKSSRPNQQQQGYNQGGYRNFSGNSQQKLNWVAMLLVLAVIYFSYSEDSGYYGWYAHGPYHGGSGSSDFFTPSDLQ
mmetsp:Transcript_21558/g.30456  ORF Transcript_21558/g.30456 Transcript_21558/m.30456 type:complete len:178 (-) Transcript_21558:111-644(-)|eukprot:CAMPEP_0175088252 /NCGR_PEP_ID=MMETSP0086_2-20121207/154_1 /TAXON_ID=136419 /ORGANISM="Unknown Unknown, Strain D1" /LENGTH=177 /DNA_ID=CAMNT_0016360683 /DNA_START=109 /DNA_END=642 /DNA_ORIENTATION=+